MDCGLEVDEKELAGINAMSRKILTAEEVYAFAVKLCDNRVDPGRGAVPGGHPGGTGGAFCGEERDL